MHSYSREKNTVLLTVIAVCLTMVQSTPINQFDPQSTTSTLTTTISSTSTSDPNSDFDAFSENLKRAAIILAAIAIGLGCLRLCLMFCKSDRRARRGTVSPSQGRTDSTVVKPDLPPRYAEALAHPVVDSGKLPSYEELPATHQLPPYTIERDYSTLSASIRM